MRFILRLLRPLTYGSPMTNAGHAIRAMRKAQDLSLRDLARIAEVEPGYLSQVERGLREPSPRWLKAVTDALGQHLAGVA